MKRWTIRTLSAIVLGILSTVAVSCALCALIDTPHMTANSTGWRMTGWYDVDRGILVVMRDRGFSVAVSYGRMPVDEATMTRMIDGAPLKLNDEAFAAATWSAAWQARTGSDAYAEYLGQFQESIWDVARGWPYPAMRYRYAYQMGQAGPNPRTTPLITPLQAIRISADPATPPDPPPQFLPTRVVARGFLINSLLYSAMWFAIIVGWRAHIRTVRRWQGYCPQCRYDLRGEMTQGCSECGCGRVS